MNHQIDFQLISTCDDIPTEKDMTLWANKAMDRHANVAELTLRIVDKEESEQLNYQFRKKKSPTNVLAFPFHGYDHEPIKLDYDLLGDIVICAPLVCEEATDQKKSLEAHWAHLIIHGILHLLGHDHQTDQEAHEMETIEIELLKQLGFPNPYEDEECKLS